MTYNERLKQFEFACFKLQNYKEMIKTCKVGSKEEQDNKIKTLTQKAENIIRPYNYIAVAFNDKDTKLFISKKDCEQYTKESNAFEEIFAVRSAIISGRIREKMLKNTVSHGIYLDTGKYVYEEER